MGSERADMLRPDAAAAADDANAIGPAFRRLGERLGLHHLVEQPVGHDEIAAMRIGSERSGPMRPQDVQPGTAYGGAGDQRNQGPGEAGKYGAVGALTRSLTHSLDDVPHTGNTSYPPDGPRIPAAAWTTRPSANCRPCCGT